MFPPHGPEGLSWAQAQRTAADAGGAHTARQRAAAARLRGSPAPASSAPVRPCAVPREGAASAGAQRSMVSCAPAKGTKDEWGRGAADIRAERGSLSAPTARGRLSGGCGAPEGDGGHGPGINEGPGAPACHSLLHSHLPGGPAALCLSLLTVKQGKSQPSAKAGMRTSDLRKRKTVPAAY